MPTIRRIPRAGFAFLAIVLVCLLIPGFAHAQTYNVTSSKLVNCGGDRGSGGLDNAGNLYFPCEYDATGRFAPNVRVYNSSNVLVKTIPIPTSGQIASVAPSPDGTSLYMADYSTSTYAKYTQQANGAYAKDTSWNPKFNYGGLRSPGGEFIATDGLGNVYIANGTWANGQPYVVLKFDATGRYITQFGTNDNSSWALGNFYWMLAGLAVTRDGSKVYTVEVGNNRLQEWDADAAGSYTAVRSWGSTAATDPNRWGDCGRTGALAAPYDVGIDAHDNVYVINTSCAKLNRSEVHRIHGDQEDIVLGAQYSGDPHHGIAVAADGTAFVVSGNVVLAPAPGAYDGAPAPAADTIAPILSSIALPATSATRTMLLAVNATDNVGVTQMRIAEGNGDIAGAPWIAYAPAVNLTIAAGDGDHRVRVQVRDAAGNISNEAEAHTVLATPPAPDTTPPVVTRINLPATATTRVVTFDVYASDDTAVTQMRVGQLDAGGMNLGPWTAFQEHGNTVTLTGANNMDQTIYAQVRDAAGNISPVSEAHIALNLPVVPPVVPAAPDTAAPNLNQVTIANPTTRQAKLVIDASDNVGVAEMRFADDYGTWGAWQPFSASPTFALRAGTGARGVFVQVRDAAKNESAALYRTTVSTGDAPAAGDGGVQNPAPPADNGGAQNPAPPVDGNAGAQNPVPPAQANQVDTVKPVLRAITLPAVTTSRLITVAIDATDDVAVTQVRLANEDGNWGAWQEYSPRMPWVLTTVAMTKGVFVQVRDAAKNESTSIFRTMLCSAPCSAPPAGALRAKVKHSSITRAKSRLLRQRVRRGTRHADKVRGTRHDDSFDISQDDHRRDVIDCGAGKHDTVLKRPGDITRNCEIVRVVRVPRG